MASRGVSEAKAVPSVQRVACRIEVLEATVIQVVLLPVEHDPLRDGDDTLLRLIEGREFCLDSIVCVRHSYLPPNWRILRFLKPTRERGSILRV